MSIKFDTHARGQLQKALGIFFDRSNKNQQTTKGLCPSQIDSAINNFLGEYGYFAKCSFGSGCMTNDPYIVFIRSDTPNIKASRGVYCRVCFHKCNTESKKIEVSINTSYKESFIFVARQQVQTYNEKNYQDAYFPYPNYDIEAIIAKLEQDLDWFSKLDIADIKSIN